MKFSIKDLYSKYDQIRSFLRIWSYLLKKSLMENFIFCAVNYFRNHLNILSTSIFNFDINSAFRISHKKTDRYYYEYYEWTDRYYEWQTDTTSGQTGTTSGKTSTTSGQTSITSGQTSTTSGQTSTTSGQTSTMSE